MDTTKSEFKVLTICGVGMGSSLILRMTAEAVFAELGLQAQVVATDTSSARSMEADIIIGQEMHAVEFEGRAPIVISIGNFLDKDELREKLVPAMESLGWMRAPAS